MEYYINVTHAPRLRICKRKGYPHVFLTVRLVAGFEQKVTAWRGIRSVPQMEIYKDVTRKDTRGTSDWADSSCHQPQQKGHCCTHMNLPMIPILGHISPIHTVTLTAEVIVKLTERELNLSAYTQQRHWHRDAATVCQLPPQA